jgi:hypothetical protein
MIEIEKYLFLKELARLIIALLLSSFFSGAFAQVGIGRY